MENTFVISKIGDDGSYKNNTELGRYSFIKLKTYLLRRRSVRTNTKKNKR